ncbi:MAG: alpha/beta hydrolase [Armatimonadetes bacterium]|nr:alpha/beta hydrolase [Armatimonadota bacterium]
MRCVHQQLLLIAAMAGVVHAQGARLPDNITLYPDIEYAKAGDTSLKLDLYTDPTAGSAQPLIIWIHGGAWAAGDKNPPGPALPWLREGWALASVNYRLSQQAVWPAQMHDCKAAVRWLRAHATEHRLDPQRFVAWGSSAGGHLVAVLGLSGDVEELEGHLGNPRQSSRVQAVIDWFGPTDFAQMLGQPSAMDHAAADSPESRLLGAQVATVPDRVKSANPITYISDDDPPFLIMHGTKDMTVPFNQSELLHAALTAAKHQSTFVPVEGAGHGFGGPQVLTHVRDFLRQCFPAAK